MFENSMTASRYTVWLSGPFGCLSLVYNCFDAICIFSIEFVISASHVFRNSRCHFSLSAGSPQFPLRLDSSSCFSASLMRLL